MALYAGESQDFFNNGTTARRFPRTNMTLFWTRFQKSASSALPLVGGFAFIEMENALYPGTIAIARKRKLRDTRTVVFYNMSREYQNTCNILTHSCIIPFTRMD